MAVTIVGIGGPSDPRTIALSTKKGNSIRNTRRQEIGPGIMREAERACHKSGHSVKTRSLSSTYNCYGMVFASRRTVVEEEDVQLILHDDEYRLVRSPAEVQIGDLVVYRKQAGADISHVGIVVRKQPDLTRGVFKITVLSQWGSGGEYFHLEHEVNPLMGDHREYYTERRLL